MSEVNMILQSADEIKKSVVYFDPPSTSDLLINRSHNMDLFVLQKEIVTKVDLIFTPYGTFVYSYNPLLDKYVELSLMAYQEAIEKIIGSSIVSSINAVWFRKQLRTKRGLSDISHYLKPADNHTMRRIDVLEEIKRQTELGPLKDLKPFGFNIIFFPYDDKSFVINGTAIEEK